MLQLDHIAVSAASLADGVAHVEATLGVALSPGGEHGAMGTHNMLLGLGPQVYLEVIAINPAATGPGRPRWFDLDRFQGAPRLTNWIARTDDLDTALNMAPPGSGVPQDLARGALRWRMAVPEDGQLPFDGAFPALIEWRGAAHPAAILPDVGCRLARLELAHPRAEALRDAIAHMTNELDIAILQAPQMSIRAVIDTPRGQRVLT